jgi:hypothetical protein
MENSSDAAVDFDKQEALAWVCPCGQLLGSQSIDPMTEELCLHIKVKDVIIVMHGGPESWVRRNCPKCGRTWHMGGKDQDSSERKEVIQDGVQSADD